MSIAIWTSGNHLRTVYPEKPWELCANLAPKNRKSALIQIYWVGFNFVHKDSNHTYAWVKIVVIDLTFLFRQPQPLSNPIVEIDGILET